MPLAPKALTYWLTWSRGTKRVGKPHAEVLAYRGESDKSFEWLDHAYNQRDPGLPEIKNNPLFKDLRHDARYAELLKKMHLPI